MGHMSEVRKLSLHPLAIHTFIKAQAGSLGKALSEAVMNSLDAFASTVQVTITAEGFRIEDNGQGFRDKAEIAAWFETLGFPHDDGNHRIYGKFGMGRAQMWAFACTAWTSNQFVMKVDVKHKGLDYELDQAPDPFNGTLIEAVFYEQLAFQARQQVEIELENLVKFVPGTVMLNGKIVNKDVAAQSWDLETPEAWFKFDKAASALSVYNAGLLVSHFPKYRYGCTGVVVTKPSATLSLNLARNSILESECKVWAKIVKSLPKTESDYARAKPKSAKFSDKEKAELSREHKAGTWTMAEVLEKSPDMLVSVTGRSIRLNDITSAYNSRPVVVTPKGDELGKRLSKLRLAHVLADVTLKNFGCKTAGELKQLFVNDIKKQFEDGANNWHQRQLEALEKAAWYDDAKVAFPDFAKGKQMFASSELAPVEKAVYYAWQKARPVLFYHLHQVCQGDEGKRVYAMHSISFGDSPVDLSWVDSVAGCWVLRKAEAVAAMAKPLPVLTKYAMARLRDFCLYVADGEEGRGQELFVKAVSETEALGALMLNLTRFYVRECREHEVEVQATKLSELDALNVE